jgi:hypothetical protein
MTATSPQDDRKMTAPMSGYISFVMGFSPSNLFHILKDTYMNQG